ncbi:MAG: rhodanese-like domain-containing protein [Acidihalobacter sp.]
MSRVGTSLSDLIRAAQASTRRVDVQRLLAWVEADEPLLLVDVREPDEYRAGHLPGALSIPRGLLEPAADRDYAAASACGRRRDCRWSSAKTRRDAIAAGDACQAATPAEYNRLPIFSR